VHNPRILTLLADYLRVYPEEHETITRLENFIRNHDDCFRRELTIGHITCSAWLLDASLRRALLTHHRKLNIWLQPGGHADGESNVIAVAMREAREESGLAEIEVVSPALFDVDIHVIPERKGEAQHLHYDCRFLLRSAGDDQYTISEESHDLAWVPLGEIARYTVEESIMRMVRKTEQLFGRHNR